jgi:hypothetical protein
MEKEENLIDESKHFSEDEEYKIDLAEIEPVVTKTMAGCLISLIALILAGIGILLYSVF